MIPTPAPPGDDKQRVLDATDIVRLIGEHITLRAKGREYVGLCPFHDDHKPSMGVVPAKQIYKCFSCGAGGDAITFVREYHKMGFREALEFLADRAGIKLTPWRPRTLGEVSDADASADAFGAGRPGLLGANLTARDFYRAILSHAEHGRAAREVIQRRSISPEMVEMFELGAAPNRWDGLVGTIAHKKLPTAPFLAANLIKAKDEGQGAFDFFRNRLMFPIHDQIGRVIAFGARRLNEDDEPKYLNSSDSPVFNKSATLYGLHQAAQEIRRSRLAIVTEGYMDTIACHQAGVKNAVATLGTALTREGARVLRRLCDTVVLLFDGDEAGQKAADRALEVFFAEPVDVRIAVMSTLKATTGAKDPDELLKQEGGRERFQQMIEGAVEALDYRFSRLGAKLQGLGLSARTRVIEEELGRLVDLGLDNVIPMRKQLIIKRIAQLLGVDEQTIAASIPKRRRAATAPVAEAAAASATGADATGARTREAREHLLGCIMLDPALVLVLEPGTEWVIGPEGFPSPAVQQVAEAIGRIAARGGAPDLRAVLAALVDVRSQAEAVAIEAEVSRLTEDRMELVHGHWRGKLLEIQRNRALAEATEDSTPVDEDGWAPADEHPSSGLARKRALYERFGGNPASVPKPLSG